MCGRYALHLRPSEIRGVLEDAGMQVDSIPPDEGPGAPRQTYNFAPGNHGIVYRADTPDRGAGDNSEGPVAASQFHSNPSMPQVPSYKLQTMKWGLIPSWTRRKPTFGSTMKTINCRDDSLALSGGMWTTMKARKRCIVLAQGFFEWFKSGREKVPHYVKRKDGMPMCFAGLWDCVQHDDGKQYTYTIITTDSNTQLKFLHDRMPVILDAGSNSIRTWLDPQRSEWSKDLQGLLKPFSGDLDFYPVSKDVGKVGNSSPSFIIPVASKENKANIANYFSSENTRGCGSDNEPPNYLPKVEPSDQDARVTSGTKREATSSPTKGEPPLKKTNRPPQKSPSKHKPNATTGSPDGSNKRGVQGSQKITAFFATKS